MFLVLDVIMDVMMEDVDVFVKLLFMLLSMFKYFEKICLFVILYDVFVLFFKKGDEKLKDWY